MSKLYELFAKLAIGEYHWNVRTVADIHGTRKEGDYMGEFLRHPIQTTRQGFHETRRAASLMTTGVVEGSMVTAAIVSQVALATEIGLATVAVESLSRVRRSTHKFKDLTMFGGEVLLPTALFLLGFPQFAVPILMLAVGYEGIQRYRRDGRRP